MATDSEKSTCVYVPRKAEDVTLPWFSKILDIPVTEINGFKIFANSFVGSGNLSDIVRVEFERNSEKLNYVVKLLPLTTDPGILEVMYSDKFDQKEIFFYKTLLPELSTEVPELTKYICKFFYGDVQEANEARSILYSSVLVLQDLKLLGYSMPTFDVGLSTTQLEEGIDFTAKLDVAGKCLLRRKQGVRLPEIYPALNDWHLPCESGNVFERFKTLSWFSSGLQTIDEVLVANQHKTTPEMRAAYSELVPFPDTILYAVFKEGQKFPTITHDDLWPHNFLVGPEDSDLPLKIIDWQMVGYTDPTHDLSHFIFSCLPLDDLNEYKITEWVTKYHKLYEQLCANHNLETRRTLLEFSDYFFTYGISYCLIWFALSCDSIFANPNYNAKLYRILELLYELRAPQFILSLVRK